MIHAVVCNGKLLVTHWCVNYRTVLTPLNVIKLKATVWFRRPSNVRA